VSEWHLITGEYPPQHGGVSDYSHLVATGLVAEGESVHVWCPSSAGKQPSTGGVAIHRDLGSISPADLHRAGRRLDQFPAPRRLLVQWVPHGYGYRAMNLPFCLWLWSRAAVKGDRVEVMVHEPFLAFGEGTWRQNAAAVVHRVMSIILLNSASRIWLSTPAWAKALRPYALGRRVPFAWLPIASNIPVIHDPEGVKSVHARYAPEGELIIGHFGTYGNLITDLLMSSVPALICGSNHTMLLLGRGSKEFREQIVFKHPEITERVHATGSLSENEVSRHISACDVMIQPYPDGISSRRTSTMVGLAHGLPIVTTSGHLTESLWAASGAVAIAPVGDATAFIELVRRLLADASERNSLGVAARALYERQFDLKHTIAALRECSSLNAEVGTALNCRAVTLDG
jgi:glycosyltransferase involved in cell wall biosynthesis